MSYGPSQPELGRRPSGLGRLLMIAVVFFVVSALLRGMVQRRPEQKPQPSTDDRTYVPLPRPGGNLPSSGGEDWTMEDVELRPAGSQPESSQPAGPAPKKSADPSIKEQGDWSIEEVESTESSGAALPSDRAASPHDKKSIKGDWELEEVK